jgi:hypothetical protein
MSPEEDQAIDAQAGAVRVLLDGMHNRLALQGCDQRALLRAVTDYMAMIIIEGALPGMQGAVLAATQTALAELVMGLVQVAGHG